MEKAEFLNRIDEVGDQLSRGGRLLCIQLATRVSVLAREDFSLFFQPTREECDSLGGGSISWFGDSFDPNNQDVRFLALCLFEQIAIDEKLYLKY